MEIVLSPAQSQLLKDMGGEIVIRDCDGNLLGRVAGVSAVGEPPILTRDDLEMLARRMRDLPADLSSLPTTAQVLVRIKSKATR